MLSVGGLNAGYGRHHVLFDVDLEAKEKDITVVVGPNGSGKSTLLKSIFGLTSIYSGSISLNGEAVQGLVSHQISRKGIAYLPQLENVFSNLTVKENLTMATYTLTANEALDRVPEVLDTFPVLQGYLERKAGTLSGGERQMLAMGMAMIRRPRIMMFDEPTGNFSPKLAKEVLAKISELREKFDMSVVLVEQNARRALEAGDQSYLLVSGKLVFKGKAKELLEQTELGRLYLGVTKGE